MTQIENASAVPVGAAPDATAAPRGEGTVELRDLAARFAGVLRGVPDGGAPVRGMRWTVSEIAAHTCQTAADATEVAHGGTSAYARDGFSAAIDEEMVRALPERDPRRLGDLVEERYATLLDALATHDDDEMVRIGTGLSIAGVRSILALDFMVHGHQVATASGQAWSVDAGVMRDRAARVLPSLLDADGARGVTATYSVTFRGARPLVYGVEDGRLVMNAVGRPIDARISADPVAFLLLSIGVLPQWRAALTGKLVAYGRRPWMAGRIQRLFPPVPHGGVGRR